MVVNCGFQRLTTFSFMQGDFTYRHAALSEAVNTQTFKQIEAFSKAVCHNLAARSGNRYETSEIIYGLTGFLAAVHVAVRRQSDKRSAARRCDLLRERKRA